MKSKNGYSHTRVINKDSVGYYIEDYVAEDVDNYEVLFHTPCEIVKISNGFDLFFDDNLIAKITSQNEMRTGESYRSLYYLKKERITEISVRPTSSRSIIVHIELVN
jgi:hypothetical protein